MPKLEFETPENVEVAYEIAGLGTRFVAWIVDQLFVILGTIGIIFLLLCAGFSFEVVEDLGDDPEDVNQAVLIVVGIGTLIWGLGSFVYFTLCELLFRGQTRGKKLTNLRVTKADGFALDPGSIFVRNVFRVVDHLPPLWVVPVLSGKAQRLGDMAGGTVVIAEASEDLSDVRTELAERPVLESEFRFDASTLAKLDDTDTHAIEQFLERGGSLDVTKRQKLFATLTSKLCEKLEIDEPPPNQRIRFLEDLLAAELRRQRRSLG